MDPLASKFILTEKRAHGEGTSAEARQNIFVPPNAPVNFCTKIRFPVRIKNNTFFINEKAYESRSDQQNYIAVSSTTNRDGNDGASAPARQNIVVSFASNSTLIERRSHGEGNSAEARQNIFVSSSAPVNFCAKFRFSDSKKITFLSMKRRTRAAQNNKPSSKSAWHNYSYK